MTLLSRSASPARPALVLGVLLLALAAAPAARAQELTEADRTALRAMAEWAEAELVRGANTEGPARLNALENQKHVMRMVEDVRASGPQLARAGVNAEIAAVGILFSDLGKNAEYLEAHARRVFPQLMQENPGLAKFKAFLLHEEPGIERMRELARRHGLSEGATQRVVNAIVGHNGPSVEGSWWRTQWDNLIRNHQGPANSAMVGRAYPSTTSAEGAVHAIFDRVDQAGLVRGANGWEGGPRKIHNDIRGNMGFQEAITEALQGNARKTMIQLDALRAQHPSLFELEVVRTGEARLRTTMNLLNHIEFVQRGETTAARIHSLDAEGRRQVVEVTEYERFWSELSKISRPVEGVRAWTAEGLREQRRLRSIDPVSRAMDREVERFMNEARSRLNPAEAARLAEVVSFARNAHHGQLRSGGEAAFSHPLRVARSVLNGGGPVSATAIEAAILHDTVEDTRTTRRDIQRRFGERVARVVDVLSIPEVAEGQSRQARDRAYYDRFRNAPLDARIVKFHDRLDNIRDMRGFTNEGRLGYLQHTRETVIRALQERSPELARRLTAEVAAIERVVRAESAGTLTEARLAQFRRADGTLDWGRMTRSGVLRVGAGVSHFALALFLKELAVVVQTGDRLRIEEFFDGLMTTDFFETYALFSAGAAGANVAYSRYLERFIKPRFVSGVLRTNVVLATGMLLPELYHGTFDGRAFAINVGSLGLSSVAVKAGLAGVRGAANLARLDRAGQLIRATAGMRRFARLGGWLFTAAETAVVLYFGDELAQRVTAWLDEEAARDAVGEAAQALFHAAGDAELSAEEFETALDDFDQSQAEFRNFLYRALDRDEQLYQSRIERLAERARANEDRSAEIRERLEQLPALRAAVERRHGSIDAYIRARTADENADIEEDLTEALRVYGRDRERHLREVYTDNRRDDAYLASSAARRFAALGGRPGSEGDPTRGRSDLAARRVRQALVSDLADEARNVSENRLQAYDDHAAALRLVRSATTDPARQAALDRRIAMVERLQRADRRLVLGQDVESEGAAGALGRELEGAGR